MIVARSVLRAGHWSGVPIGEVRLDYEARILRRKRLTLEGGGDLLVDLPETISLDEGDALSCEAGLVAVRAADEPLIEVRGPRLARLAWHIGNRHTPCEVHDDRLVIRRDHVLADMLARLGADVTETHGPFTPEGGAYGHGRTFGHDHDPSAHSHQH